MRRATCMDLAKLEQKPPISILVHGVVYGFEPKIHTRTLRVYGFPGNFPPHPENPYYVPKIHTTEIHTVYRKSILRVRTLRIHTICRKSILQKSILSRPKIHTTSTHTENPYKVPKIHTTKIHTLYRRSILRVCTLEIHTRCRKSIYIL